MNTAQPIATPVSVPVNAAETTIYRFVDVNSSGKLVNASAGGRAAGVRSNQPDAAGKPGAVDLVGIQMVEAGGTVTAGDSIKSDSVGRGVTASAADVAAGQARGIALGSATVGGTFSCLLYPSPAVVQVSGVQALTDSGTINNTTLITTLAITGTDAYGMSDGLYVGQRKITRVISAASTPVGTITPTTVSADTAGGTTPASVVVNTAGQEIEWEWLADGWKIVDTKSAGVETVADAGTANLMLHTHMAAVSGTDDMILPAGWYPGQTTFCTVISAASTPILTISGLFYDEDGSADGIDVNHNPAAAGDCALLRWGGARWVLVNHINATIST